MAKLENKGNSKRGVIITPMQTQKILAAMKERQLSCPMIAKEYAKVNDKGSYTSTSMWRVIMGHRTCMPRLQKMLTNMLNLEKDFWKN